jgi:hypothetical protein
MKDNTFKNYFIFTQDENTERVIFCGSKKHLAHLLKKHRPVWFSKKGFSSKEEAEEYMNKTK